MAINTTITFSLDADSINRAINELRTFTTDFQRRCRELRRRIAERIQWNAQTGFSNAIADDTFLEINGNKEKARIEARESSVQVQVNHEDDVTIIFADGDEAIFIEYGAGVYHNGNPGDSPHPWGLQQGFVIGGYGENGVKNVWGYRDGQSVILTHGTPAAMPLYHGAEEAIRAIGEIIQEVFND